MKLSSFCSLLPFRRQLKYEPVPDFLPDFPDFLETSNTKTPLPGLRRLSVLPL